MHVAAGSLAVVAGAIALGAPKGRPVHIAAGRAFVLTMGLSSLLGAGLGLMLADAHYITFHAGVLATYLIVSSWMAARNRSGSVNGITVVLAALNGANCLALTLIGVVATASGAAFLGYRGENYLFLAGMAALAVGGDVNLIWRRTLSDRHRIARHLWRMCLSFFIAAGSAFTGPGSKALPKALQESGLLSLPELIIVLLMVFWLVRTLWQGRAATPKANR
ncbi:putative membrane protein [Asticcacaulis biprosthecium C19]|uniref:Putative membrane protein n=2 Tax=Asticcacaulis biprosthecium TaxID=76891 RepID=F4QU46_9CAUL|nr:putative membrane protein [Asticcacaulis biprosthecium C19]